MNIKQDFPWLPILGAIIIIMLIARNVSHHHSDLANPFITERAQKRTIISMLKAQGILVPQEIIKIGNLINGIVRYLYAEENELIEKGQLLVEIDDSLEDSGINTAFGNLDAAQAALTYQVEFLKRQEQLFGCKQISLDAYQQAERDYQASLARVESTKALYETAKLIYNNKRIRSPVSGMIMEKKVSAGETASNIYPANVLYLIASDITRLRAHIVLDTHSALEILKPDLIASMSTNVYPHKTFSGAISEIIKVSRPMESADAFYARFIVTTASNKICHCAVVPIENNDLSLRPGMTITANITIAEKENVLSVPNQAFKITKDEIQQLAQELSYDYQPLEGKQLHEAMSKNNTKTVWILHYKTFVEKAVTTGISDAEYVEIMAGLDGSEDIVSSIHEWHTIKNCFSQFFTSESKA